MLACKYYTARDRPEGSVAEGKSKQRMTWWHLQWTRCPVCGVEVLSWWDEAQGARVCVTHECRSAQEVAA